jgi:hypothetical protein
MAHSTIHFAAGVALGSAIALPSLIRSWRANDKLAPSFRYWLFLSYGLGVFAVIPGLLRRAGVPDGFCDGWWMNIFLFYPVINAVKSGGMITGGLAIALGFVAQYALMLAALVRKRGTTLRRVAEEKTP